MATEPEPSKLHDNNNQFQTLQVPTIDVSQQQLNKLNSSNFRLNGHSQTIIADANNNDLPYRSPPDGINLKLKLIFIFNKLSLIIFNEKIIYNSGGFGWVIVFASFMCNVIVDGIIFSFGILLPEISNEFNVTKATTAWIGSLQTGFYLIVGMIYSIYSYYFLIFVSYFKRIQGPLVSALALRYDRRKITIIGSFLAAFGFVISYFAPNVVSLYLTFGLLSGKWTSIIINLII